MSLILKVVLPTILKTAPVQSNLLSAEQKSSLKVGQEIELAAYKNSKNNHLELAFADGKPTRYVFRLHVEVWQDGDRVVPAPVPERILLDVPFFSQVARAEEPTTKDDWEQNRTCNTSSNAMAAKFFGAKITGDDDYYRVVQRYGDTTDHGAQGQALAAIGVQSTWHTDLGFEDLDQSLEAGLPVVIGILHRGTLSNPTGGHILVVIGRTPNGDYIVNDPFGSLLDRGGAYTGSVNNGRRAIYSRSVLRSRWLVSSDDEARSGWGRLFYGNR